MSARGRVLSYLATAVIALGGFVTVGAIPAAGASSRIVEYVALGDSYAAGLGAGPLTTVPACRVLRAIQLCLNQSASIWRPMRYAVARQPPRWQKLSCRN
jgi:hypothetical protein